MKATLFAALAALIFAPSATLAEDKGHYADINGLQMYYEVHGQGAPILLIHGGLCTIEVCFGPLIEKLSATHQVIAYEFQGHGHTADIDRPLDPDFLADDASKLLGHLGIAKADVLGYSIGADVAFHLALGHPEQVSKLITMSLMTEKEGGYPELSAGMEGLKAEMFEGSPWLEAYKAVAPDPSQFQGVLDKISAYSANATDTPMETVASLKMPVFFILGDSDMVRPEHATDLFRAVGGGVFGDVLPMPNARLAILPGTSHVGLISRADWIAGMVEEFLGAPVTAN
jgi:pimeloyl-ACP methyl ester carboxylesterase